MPWTPTIGVQFQALRLVSADGATITVSITVTDAAGRFSTVINNSSQRSSRMVFYDPAPQGVTVPPGETTIGTVGPRRWATLSMSFSSA